MNETREMFNLNGKTAVITGGAGLLGVKHAEALLEFGANCILLDINEEALNRKVYSLQKEYDDRVNGIKTDITNPDSVKAALSSLARLPERRVAILGDMLNLGKQSAELHSEIGAFAAESGVDSLICCGSEASYIYDGYKSFGVSEGFYYRDKADLAAKLPELIKKGDAVLVKASNSMMFEKLLPVLKRL